MMNTSMMNMRVNLRSPHQKIVEMHKARQRKEISTRPLEKIVRHIFKVSKNREEFSMGILLALLQRCK